MDCFVAVCFAHAKQTKRLAMTKFFRISFVPFVPFVVKNPVARRGRQNAAPAIPAFAGMTATIGVLFNECGFILRTSAAFFIF
jgi:hypothetical protein